MSTSKSAALNSSTWIRTSLKNKHMILGLLTLWSRPPSKTKTSKLRMSKKWQDRPLLSMVASAASVRKNTRPMDPDRSTLSIARGRRLPRKWERPPNTSNPIQNKYVRGTSAQRTTARASTGSMVPGSSHSTVPSTS